MRANGPLTVARVAPLTDRMVFMPPRQLLLAATMSTPGCLFSDVTRIRRTDFSSADPFYATCHTMLDPIGFGFEHYDGIGHWSAFACSRLLRLRQHLDP